MLKSIMKWLLIVAIMLIGYGCPSPSPNPPDPDPPVVVDPVVDPEEPVVYEEVDIMPEFEGGPTTKFMGWVAANIEYPEQAVTENISGKVFIQFVIDEDGKLIDAEVVQSAHPLLDEEALRVVNASPMWIPGFNVIDGHPTSVRVQFTVPINFLLK